MLEDVEDSRSCMKRMKSTGEMTEPWGTPTLMECRLERKPSTSMAINPSDQTKVLQHEVSQSDRLIETTKAKA